MHIEICVTVNCLSRVGITPSGNSHGNSRVSTFKRYPDLSVFGICGILREMKRLFSAFDVCFALYKLMNISFLVYFR